MDVVGGGPAGVAAAISAPMRGADVTLFEKSQLPRHNVCGEFLSPEAIPLLEHLGVWNRILEAGAVPIDRFSLHFRKRSVTHRLAESAYGISRFTLDQLLLDAVRQRGVTVVRKRQAKPSIPGVLATGRPPVAVTGGGEGTDGESQGKAEGREERQQATRVYKQAKSDNWSYRFRWNGPEIRRSTKQANMRVAERMEAAHKTALAKGEVGIRERKPVPTLAVFAERNFLPFVRSTFKEKFKTREYHECGVKSLLKLEPLASRPLNAITTKTISGYVAKRQKRGLQVSSINRELQVLRRMFALAQEWGEVDKVLPKVKMLPGERLRERVLTLDEEDAYFAAARSKVMNRHKDPELLHDVAAIPIDCGPRPEECFRLRREYVQNGLLDIPYGKSDNARRRVPMTDRVRAVVEMRLLKTEGSEWLFPANTVSGHIEKSSLKKQHPRALRVSGVEPFELYTFRHTCLTRWAPHMDPWTLAYLAGHRDMSITKRYIHPQQHTIREAMERARAAAGGHTSGHTATEAADCSAPSTAAIQ